MRHDTALDYRRRLQAALRHIQLHLDDDLTPGALAPVAHFSPFHFSRIFSAMVGESIGAHVRRLRLERAAGALRHSDDQVLEIALRSGYQSHEAFTRAFRAHFGCAPREYRDAHEPPALPRAPSAVHWGLDGAVDRFIPILRENPMKSIEIRNLPAQRLAALRHLGPYMEIGSAFERLFCWAGPRGLFGPTTRAAGIYYDDPQTTEPAALRADACMTVDADFQPEPKAPVRTVDLPDQRCACATFKGPYERLGEAYNWLFGVWLPDSGCDPASEPCLEFYLNNPQTTAPGDLLTEICVPLEADGD